MLRHGFIDQDLVVAIVCRYPVYVPTMSSEYLDPRRLAFAGDFDSITIPVPSRLGLGYPT
jgi:hypothetical protein